MIEFHDVGGRLSEPSMREIRTALISQLQPISAYVAGAEYISVYTCLIMITRKGEKLCTNITIIVVSEGGPMWDNIIIIVD